MNSPARSAIDLSEEALHLLRRAPVATIATYYLGTLPFVLGFLFFWTDMSESALARERAAPEALGMALLYLWMITLHAQYSRRLRSQLLMETSSAPSLRSWLSMAASQMAIQPAKFVVLPLALLIGLPFTAAVAFFHNASAMESLALARKQASLWPKQNWTFLSILFMLAIVVFVNVAMALFALPYLVKMFLGIESVFTRTAYSFLNTTFLAVALGVSYLLLNPFVRAFYVLRCFYGESLTTAQDLRTELKASSAFLPLLVLLVTGLLPAQHLSAQPGASRTAEGDLLNQSIDRVLRKPEYSWRLPRVSKEDRKNENWLVRNTLAFLNYTEQRLKQLGHWIDRMADKLGDLLGNKDLAPLNQPANLPPVRSLRMLVVIMLAAVIGAAIYFVWQMLAKRNRLGTQVTQLSPVPIDLNRADLQADQQPLEQWLRMARDCVERRDLRLAMRALYLAGLSILAAESLITLRSSKSDRDYVRELQRRARNRPELSAAFGSTLNVFERVWYGLYDVDMDLIEQVRGNLEQMRTRAQ